MAVLVTGGAGYIGSHCVAALLDRGEDVTVVDNLSTGHRAAVTPGARFYLGDIRDRTLMNHVFTQQPIDAVIHFAAFSLVGESIADPNKYFLNNTGGSAALLDAMAAHQVKNLVFSSTAAVYGEPPQSPIEEDAPRRPINPYGQSKKMVEDMFPWNAQSAGLRWAALRYFNVAGARTDASIGEDHRPETHLIPLVLSALLGRREGIAIYGDDYDTPDGTCIRDYIHVEDLIEAHLRALVRLRAGGDGGAFNLGVRQGFSVREIIEAAFQVTGRRMDVKTAARRPGDPAVLVASDRRARALLSWTPRFTDPASIIASAWRWHSAHPDGYGT